MSQIKLAIIIVSYKNIEIAIKKGELVAVIGRSGSGKSSLMMALINELSSKDAEPFFYAVNPSLSFVAQKPWIRNETVRENILFGKD